MKKAANSDFTASYGETNYISKTISVVSMQLCPILVRSLYMGAFACTYIVNQDSGFLEELNF